MAKAKQGDYFSCAECGLVIVVDEPCGCSMTELICCEALMDKGKLAANKAKKKAQAQAATKSIAVKAVRKGPEKTAKAGKTAAKPAVKKPVTKKVAAKSKKS